MDGGGPCRRLACVGANGGAGVAAPKLRVMLALPEHFGERSIILREPKTDAINVVIENISDKPLNVWNEWCSWGRQNLAFEITDAAGKKQVIERAMTDYLKNYPDYLTLAPGDAWILPALIRSGDWPGFPEPRPNSEARLTLRALYRINPDADTKKLGVWTGEVASEARVCLLALR